MQFLPIVVFCFILHAHAAYVYEKPLESVGIDIRGDFEDLDLNKEITTIIHNGVTIFDANKLGGNKFGANNVSANSIGSGKFAVNKKQCDTSKCFCGAPSGNRIVGGSQVRQNKYPWTAQLLKGKYYARLFCGGALINDLFVLTAAHCVHNNRDEITVKLLQLDRSSRDPGVVRKAIKSIVHPSYDPVRIVNDVALLKLDSAIPMNSGVRPVCLPTASHNFDGKDAIVAGWGVVKEGGSTSNYLQEAVVPIITNQECRRTRYKEKIQEGMLCAGLVKTGGKDACQGDSGGPLIVNEGRFKLAGVVSFGFGCAQVNAPGVYTRISKYVSWINQNTKDGCYCSN